MPSMSNVITDQRAELSQKYPLVNFASYNKYELKNLQTNIQFIASRFNFDQFKCNYQYLFNILSTLSFINFDILILHFIAEMRNIVIENVNNSQPVFLDKTQNRAEFLNFLTTHRGIINGEFIFFNILGGNLTLANQIFFNTQTEQSVYLIKHNSTISRNIFMFPFLNLNIPFVRTLFGSQVLTKHLLLFNLFIFFYSSQLN